MNPAWIKAHGNGALLTCHVAPRASRTAIQGLYGAALKIRLKAPPVEGKANEALISFLSEKLDIPRRNIALKSGLSQRRKIITISGISAAEIEKRLLNPN